MKKHIFRPLVWLLIVAMLLQTTPVVLAQESPQTEELPTTETVDGVQEVIGERTANTKTFRLSDGSYVSATYPQNVHYAADGEWKEIDNRFSDSTGLLDDDVENAENAFKIKFAKKAKDGKLATIKQDKAQLSWSLEGSSKTAVRVLQQDAEDDPFTLKNVSGALVYENIVTDTDLRYDVTSGSVKESILLKSTAAPESFSFAYVTKKLTYAAREDGTIALFPEGEQESAFLLEKPYMLDAAGAYSDAVEMRIEETKKGFRLVLTPDRAWLSDAARVFPVTVDPTVHTKQDMASVQTTYYTEGNHDLQANGLLYVGNEKGIKGKVRSALKFQLPTLSNTDIVLKAVVGLFQTSYSHVGNTTNVVNAYMITGNWAPGAKPGVNGAPPAYDETVLDYATIGVSTHNQFAVWDVTAAAKKWYNDPSTNKGILLRAADEERRSIVRFCSMQNTSFSSSVKPVLYLHYMDSKGINPYQDFSQLPSVYKSSFSVNNYTGNLVYSYADLSMPGTRATLSITHTYNAADHNDNDVVSRDFPGYSSGLRAYYGKGFRTNLNQALSDKTINDKNYKVYTDTDGTKLYFEKTSAGNKWEYEFDKKLYIDQNSNGDFVIHYDDGSRLVFWQYTRRLFQIYDASGNVLTLGYDGDNHYPLTVTDGLGQVTRLAYQGGRLQSVTDTAGRKTTYAYTTDGKLDSITDPQGGKTNFAYDGAGYLTAVTSPEAQKTALQYGSATPRTGLLKLTKATQYAGTTEGGRWQYAYGAGQTTITDRDGGSVTSVFDNVGRAVTKYDRDGNVVSTKYAEGASSTVVGNITTKQVDTKVKKQFSEGYVENLLQNSSAEKETIWNPSQWGKGPVTATTGFVTDCVHSGNRALRVQVSATTVDRIGRLQQLSTLKVGETYTFSAYVKTQNVAGEGGAMLYVICGDGTDSGDPSRVFESRVVTGTEDWQRMSVTFTVPANTCEVRVHGGLWKSTGTLWMDDCQLEKGSVANRYNYVQNGSFEFTSGGQPTDWITGSATFSGGTATISDRGVRNGKVTSIRGTCNVLDAFYTQMIPVTVQKGQLVSFSAWAKANSLPTTGLRKFSVDVSYNYTDNGKTGRDYQRFDFDPECTSWQCLKDSLVTKGVTHEIEIKVLYRDNGNTAYFDDVQLFIGDAGSSFDYYTAADGANMDGKLKYSYDGTKRTSYAYNDAAKNLTGITYPDGTTESYTYDSCKRIKTAKDRIGVNYAYEYDAWGNATKMTVTGDGKTATVTSTYKNGNMVETTTDTNGRVTRYDYDPQKGTLRSSTANDGTVTTYTYDAYDRVTAVTVGTQTVHYTYNRYGLESITAANGVVYSFDSDSFYDDVAAIRVGGQTLIEHTYAANNGRLLQSTYGNGTKLSLSYASAWDDTVTEKRYNGVQSAAYGYDASGNVGTKKDADAGLTYQYEYDEIGRPTAEQNGTLSRTRLFYNADNEPTQVSTLIPMHGGYAAIYGDSDTFVKNWITNFSYNAKKQLEKVNFGHGEHVYTYDGLGRLTEITQNDNVNRDISPKTTITYLKDKNGNETYEVGTYTTGGKTDSYTYDAAGNIRTYTQNGVLQNTYTYDALGQLTRDDNAVLNATYTYSYDAGGNLLEKRTYPYTTGDLGTPTDTVSYAYGDTAWQDKLTAYDGEAITYDAIGNPLTYRGGSALEWKNGRRLAKYTNTAYTIQYEYTTDGIRTAKTVNGQKTTYLLQGDTMIQERRANGDVIGYAHDATGKPVGFEYYDNAAGTMTYCYYRHNLQGDITDLCDRRGNSLVHYTYDAWGKLISITGEKASTLGVINPLRYRGYYYDSETGLYYVSSRYYDPEVGRFINADDVDYLGADGSQLSYNLFAYCMNNPVNRFEIDGNWSLPNWAKVAIGAVALAGAVALTVATGGGAAAVAVGVAKVVGSVALSTAVSAGAGYLKNGKQGAIDGACNGFMFGSLSACGGAALKYASTAVNKASVAKSVSGSKKIANTVTGYTKHGLNQAIGRNGVGVKPSAILDTVRNPVSVVRKIDNLGRISTQYRGTQSTVVLNEIGKIVSCWAKSSKYWRI